MSTVHFPGLDFRLDYLIDLSSLVTVASFSVRAMLPLRALAVASQFFASPFFVLQPVPLWTPVGWTVLFLAINLYHITRILLEPRPVGFTDDEQRLYDLVFRSFQPQEFMKLVVPVSGSVSAGQGQVQIGKFAPRDMIGTGIAMTGQPSFIDAECTQAVRYICWLTLTSRPFWRRIPVWR